MIERKNMELRGCWIIVDSRLGNAGRSLRQSSVGSTVRPGLVVLAAAVAVLPSSDSCTSGWEVGSSEGCCTFRPLGSKDCRPGFGPAFVGLSTGSCLDILPSDCQLAAQSLPEVGSYSRRSIPDTAGAAAAAVVFREERKAAAGAAFCRNLQES